MQVFVEGGMLSEPALVLWSLLATGPLSFCGLILVIVGKGIPRFAAAVWSFLALGIFFAHLALAVNSFHGDGRRWKPGDRDGTASQLLASTSMMCRMSSLSGSRIGASFSAIGAGG